MVEALLAVLALIPARAGSKRLPNKNTRELGGRPLISWTIDAALESNCFEKVVVCSDSLEILALAQSPVICHQRQPSADDEKDVEWVFQALNSLRASPDDEIALLRPTSPFRGPDCIIRAVQQWEACKDRIDSLRAMRRASEHAFKQWVVEGYIDGPGDPDTPYGLMSWKHLDGSRSYLTGAPEMPSYPTMVPITTAAAKKRLYEFPTQSLTDAYIQCGALEIFRADLPLNHGNLSGDQIGMFLMDHPECLNIDTERDWEEAERVARHPSLRATAARRG